MPTDPQLGSGGILPSLPDIVPIQLVTGSMTSGGIAYVSSDPLPWPFVIVGISHYVLDANTGGRAKIRCGFSSARVTDAAGVALARNIVAPWNVANTAQRIDYIECNPHPTTLAPWLVACPEPNQRLWCEFTNNRAGSAIYALTFYIGIGRDALRYFSDTAAQLIAAQRELDGL